VANWYGNACFLRQFILNRPFYQDRLGTNIGKVEEKHVSAGLTAMKRLGYRNLTQTTKYVTEYIQPLSGKDHDACDGFMCCFEALTHGAWHTQ
jgi:hypothetical protein